MAINRAEQEWPESECWHVEFTSHAGYQHFDMERNATREQCVRLCGMSIWAKHEFPQPHDGYSQQLGKCLICGRPHPNYFLLPN